MQAEGVDPSSSVQWSEGLAPLYFMLAFKWGRIPPKPGVDLFAHNFRAVNCNFSASEGHGYCLLGANGGKLVAMRSTAENRPIVLKL
jgi:hypothetical protein